MVLPPSTSIPFPGPFGPADVPVTVTLERRAREADSVNPELTFFVNWSPLKVPLALSSQTPSPEAFSTVFPLKLQTLKSRQIT
jgi:hypothetical protein